VCGDPCDEEPHLGEKGAAVDRADGGPVQIRVRWRGQGSPLFPVLEEKQLVRMDCEVRGDIPQPQ